MVRSISRAIDNQLGKVNARVYMLTMIGSVPDRAHRFDAVSLYWLPTLKRDCNSVSMFV
jgi:hypothetical protein